MIKFSFAVIFILCATTFDLEAQKILQDLNFGKSGMARSSFAAGKISRAFDMDCDSNGNTHIFGSGSTALGSPKMAAAAYKQNGFPDSSFGKNGMKLFTPPGDSNLSAECYKIIKSADGGYFLAGYKVMEGGLIDAAVLKIKSNGTPDFSWGNAGWCIADLGGNDFAYGIVQFSDSTLNILCRSYRTIGSDSSAICRIKQNGMVDTGFGHKGYKIIHSAYALYVTDAVLTDSNRFYFVGGKLYSIYNPVLARFNKNGEPDTTFNLDGYAEFASTEGVLSDVTIDVNKMPIAVGYTSFNKKTDMVVYRYLTDGKPDFKFAPNGRIDIRISDGTDFANAVLAVDSGDLYVLGKSPSKSGMTQTVLIKVDHTGNYQPIITGNGCWINHISNRDDDARSLGRDKYGRIFLGGTYTEYTNQTYFMLLRLGTGWPASANQHPDLTLRMYPNPATDRVSFNGGETIAENAVLTISDINGKEILHEQYFKGQELILQFTSKIKPGLYQVNLKNTNGMYTGKLIVN